MKIVHVNTYDIEGGAARATVRLHSGLRAMGQDSHLVVCRKQSSDCHTHLVTPVTNEHRFQFDRLDSVSVHHLSAIQHQYINNNRTGLSNILFSFPYPGMDLTTLPIVQAADIIHLHWMADYQSPITLNALFQLGKPVVWTLHDMWAFTGGCHSSGDCTRYQSGCHDCPQLAYDPFGLPAAVLQDKVQLLSGANLTIIAPSENMAAFARQSQLLQSSRIEVIHNSIDTHVFQPIDKITAKQQLGLQPNTRVIAFGCEDGQQRSKGMVELIEVIRLCQQNSLFKALIDTQHLQFVCCGDVHPDIECLNLPLLKMGVIDDDARLQQFYAVADVFLQPSLEESFGNMAIESLCCGTPVIGFDVGVAPEAIAPDHMGRIVPLGDIQSMTNAILDFVDHPEKWQAMGESCHVRASNQFSQQNQAHQVLTLYQDLLGSQTRRFSTDNSQSVKPQDFETTNCLSWNCTVGSATQSVVQTIVWSCVSRELQQAQATLAHRDELLRVLRDRIHNFRQQIGAQDNKIQSLNHELSIKAEELEAMKSSKFWKLRMLWVKVRSRLGRATP